MITNLITGITSQDGILLSKYLLNLNQEIFGVVSKQTDQLRINLIKKLMPQVNLIEISDFSRLEFNKLLMELEPDNVYNFAAVSSVKLSFEEPELTNLINYEAFCMLAEAALEIRNKKIRVFQPSSSEMFGNSIDNFQDEHSNLNPISPYGESKAKAHLAARTYRSNGLYISTGILFNHESEFRKEGFLFEKITAYMARRKLGKREVLELGTLDVQRDWGYAGDFVKGIYRSMQIEEPSEFVFATGVQRTVKNVLTSCLEIIGDDADYTQIVKTNNDYLRPKEKFSSCGNFTKARNELGWYPETSFTQMLKIMISKKIEEQTNQGLH
jgi:GDPmannose 4,6-dehydratase